MEFKIKIGNRALSGTEHRRFERKGRTVILAEYCSISKGDIEIGYFCRGDTIINLDAIAAKYGSVFDVYEDAKDEKKLDALDERIVRLRFSREELKVLQEK